MPEGKFTLTAARKDNPWNESNLDAETLSVTSWVSRIVLVSSADAWSEDHGSLGWAKVEHREKAKE